MFSFLIIFVFDDTLSFPFHSPRDTFSPQFPCLSNKHYSVLYIWLYSVGICDVCVCVLRLFLFRIFLGSNSLVLMAHWPIWVLTRCEYGIHRVAYIYYIPALSFYSYFCFLEKKVQNISTLKIIMSTFIYKATYLLNLGVFLVRVCHQCCFEMKARAMGSRVNVSDFFSLKKSPAIDRCIVLSTIHSDWAEFIKIWCSESERLGFYLILQNTLKSFGLFFFFTI